jgi:hypothetical protein
MTTGPISGAIYTIDIVDTTNSVVTKRSSDGTFLWATGITGFVFYYDRLISSNDETYLYAMARDSQIVIFQISTSDGNLIKSWTDVSYDASRNSILFISADDTTLYMSFRTSYYNGVVCSLLISSTSYDCHIFDKLTDLDLMMEIGPPTFFAVGRRTDSLTLKMVKFTFGNTTPIWNKDLSCNFSPG